MHFTPARIFDSLSLKFSATTFGLVVAVTAILSLYAADELRRNVEAAHSQGQQATARKLALELDTRARERVQALEALAADLDRARLGDAAYLERYLASQLLARLPDAGGAAQRVREGSEGSALLSSLTGARKYYSFARVPTPDWTLVLATPEDVALAPLDQLRARVYWTGALLGAVALLVAWLVTRRLTAGLRSATRQLDAMSADENLTRSLPEVGDAETRALFASFNRLSSVVERQRDALRASEARLRGLYENAPVAFSTSDRAGRVVSMNRHFVELFGFEPGELTTVAQWRERAVARSDQRRGHETDWITKWGDPADPAPQAPALAQTVRCKDGSVKTVLLTRTRLGDEMLLCAVDITDLERAEHEIAANLDAMRRLQDVSLQAVESDDLDRFLGEVTEAALGLAGADFGALRTVDPANGALVLRAHRGGLPDDWLAYWHAPGADPGACEQALALGERVVVEDVRRSPLYAGTRSLDHLQRAGVRAVVSTPLVGRSGRPLGVVSMHFRAPTRLDAAVGQRLDLLARLAADSIENHATADALRESQERLQLLIDHAPAALVMFDAQMRYLALSRRWRADYGLGDQAIVGRSHYEIFPEIPQQWKDVHRRALAGEIVRADADPFARLDGSTQWVTWEVRPWRAHDGTIGGIVIFSEDVTARRQAELERQMLASAIEQSQESVIITDPAMRITYVNAAFTRISGYAADEVIGRSAATLGGDTTPKATLDGLAAALAAGVPWTGEFLNRRRDGHVGIDLARIAPVRDAEGRITHYVSVQEDVTDRRRLEGEMEMHRRHLEALVDERTNQLRAANERLSATQFAMDSVGIGIQWVNPADGRIVYTNRVGAALAGRTVEALTGLTVSDVDPNYPPAEYARLVAQLRERRRMQFESVNVAPDGRATPIEMMLHYLEAGAGAGEDRIVAFLTDIGQRKAAQAVLVQARADAESANLAKSAFLANMSHEIRTPLNGVLGMAGLLRRTPMSQKQAGYLDRIEASGRHLLAVINDILDLSKIEAGRLELDAQDFALDDLMSDVESTVDARVAAKGLALSFDVQGVPHWLHGDRTRLAQALVNYLGNAVKFTQTGGITVRCRALEQSADACLLRFEVRDTGVGLARDALARVFEAFEQGDMSTTREFGGTGLGLTITRRLAHAMGGDAGADSEPGRGSTFWFTARLGLARVASVGPGAVPTDAEQTVRREFAGTRVLLVEDDPVSREVARILLESAGLVVEAVENGLEAVRAVEARDFALVLMDVQMPVMDGLQATDAIRRLARGAAMPVIAQTANAFAEDREACLRAGMDDVVIKPLEPDVLFARLLAWLRPRA